jgi:hypothetical protein
MFFDTESLTDKRFFGMCCLRKLAQNQLCIHEHATGSKRNFSAITAIEACAETGGCGNRKKESYHTIFKLTKYTGDDDVLPAEVDETFVHDN